MTSANNTDYTTPVSRIHAADCERLIELALEEDAPLGDPTSEAIFPESATGAGTIVAKEKGILCGQPVIDILLNVLDKKYGYKLQSTVFEKDGVFFNSGDRLIRISGSLRAILRTERVILNFLQYLSGISTTVHEAVAKAGDDLIIVDTRKTIPGYRRLVKYAVHTGGGSNHRIHLSDMIMIKDNHIAASGSVALAIQKARAAFPHLPLEIEVDTIQQLKEALPGEPDYVLLDNMNREEIYACLEMISTSPARTPKIEISGGWRPDRFWELEGLGELRVSMSYITGQSRFLDLSMEIEADTL